MADREPAAQIADGWEDAREFTLRGYPAASRLDAAADCELGVDVAEDQGIEVRVSRGVTESPRSCRLAAKIAGMIVDRLTAELGPDK